MGFLASLSEQEEEEALNFVFAFFDDKLIITDAAAAPLVATVHRNERTPPPDIDRASPHPLPLDQIHRPISTMAQDGKLKMRYLPLRARAEPIHMVLKHGNIDYEAITIPFAEWPACKASGEFTLFGQLPSMQLPSGKIICQTAAIVRYAAHVAGISPPDAEATADSDMIWELVSELNLINPILNWFEAGSQDFTTSKAAYFAALPGHLSAAERVLGDKQFFAGASPSYGDFGLLHILYNSTTVEPTCLDGHPVIGAWFARMKGLPSMQKYLAERPKEVGRPGSLITTLQL